MRGARLDDAGLRGARLPAVQRVGCRVGELEGVDGLPGARGTSAPLLGPGPRLAAHLGIAVDDEPLPARPQP